MKYYLIAGEASGDLHAGNLVKEIKKLDPNAEFRGWGGDRMQKEGVRLVKHYRELAFMGFLEVLKNIKTIFKNIAFCKEDILQYSPDAIIFIDYPGFNLRIASWAKKENFKTIYYISPQVWAWKEKRVEQIKTNVDKMLVILPFEKDFYKKHGYEVDFVGHPLLDALEQDDDAEEKIQSQKPIIALLPGSRKQEIRIMLPLMLEVAGSFPEYEFIIAKAPSQEDNFYNEIPGADKYRSVKNKTYQLLKSATAALVTSGTATLEAALFNVPEVVCYKGGAVSYFIGRQLVNVKYISLVNLIMDKPVVKELIQNDLNKENLVAELQKILPQGENREEILNDYAKLKEKLGKGGASKRAAEIICGYLNI